MGEFELPINWRIARHGFRSPSYPLHWEHSIQLITQPPIHQPETNLILFLPQNRTYDLLALRDWLQMTDNNRDGYLMFGCYQTDHARITFIGVKFLFFRDTDASYFRFHMPK